ncbi:uridine diphosphate-N-acetylglucosamine-binding protein YvcK [Shewanella corallii]|uniref:Putative gluconeogenesis factor n=1 Tax=Shewanella corallii TaxID=560080 RepID=A0ABT0N6M6_9GAMM|nr:uridine diphosphate-N-acetylglucosamine-binding protein YvcK [Shewanella corallii]MCL2914027.1 uridine diphosphate-N-acetylglucosamine-binding protein YvcK [Shewanella corallii]
MADKTGLEQISSVVAIGGGHGLGRVLSALSFLGDRLSGIVTTTDNGGSTGRLRQSADCIAWGDLRNCLSQLCPHPTLNSVLFEYRFSDRDELAGHSLGNLMLYAMDQMSVRPLETIKLVSGMLGVEANLFPMSEAPTNMVALGADGRAVWGELAVDEMAAAPGLLALSPQVKATAEALEKLHCAELIVLGPGSFYTSIVPPLLIPEIAEAIQHSKGQLILIDNLRPEGTAADCLALTSRRTMITDILAGRSPDITLVHADTTEMVEQGMDKVFRTRLIGAVDDGLHDRALLEQALERIVIER